MLTLDNMKALYIVFGEEKASTGTPHLQGYMYFPNARTMSSVVARCPRLSLKPVINKKQCILYSMKGEQTHAEWDEHKEKGPNYGKNAVVTELGVRPRQGKRTDLHEYISAVEDGVRDLKRLRYEHPSVLAKYPKFATDVLFDYMDIPDTIPVLENYWYYGPTGTGKSRLLGHILPRGFCKMRNKWWDGYLGQPDIIIEEMNPDDRSFANLLKQWVDHRKFPAEIKNTKVDIRPLRFWITSNYSIRECFPDHRDYEPLERRFREIYVPSPPEVPHNPFWEGLCRAHVPEQWCEIVISEH